MTSATTTEVIVIGAGQAGIATSEHLRLQNIPHIVLEKADIAHHWRSRRWDSLVANGPAWHDRFPNREFSHTSGEGFPGKEEVADYFVDYAKMIDAPVHTGVEVIKVTRNQGRSGFTVSTHQGEYHSQFVVSATGPFQIPVIPPIAPAWDGLHQIHSEAYKRPEQLPEGGVLVVGAGSSGVQIADELNRAGRSVHLSIGAHDRLPRRYRDRDFVWWLGVLGLWDLEKMQPGKAHVTIAVSGAYGGQTIDFRRLASEGVQLVGSTSGFSDGLTDGKVTFAADIVANIQAGDDSYHATLAAADAYVQANGLDLPDDPDARKVWPEPACLRDPITSLDLKVHGIKSIIWATGYRTDYSWLQVDALDEQGKPDHQRGVAKEPGVYFVGLPWLSRRGSSFIWGVWHDAKHIVGHINTQRSYINYRP